MLVDHEDYPHLAALCFMLIAYVSTRPCLVLATMETSHTFWHKLSHMFSRNTETAYVSAMSQHYKVFEYGVAEKGWVVFECGVAVKWRVRWLDWRTYLRLGDNRC